LIPLLGFIVLPPGKYFLKKTITNPSHVEMHLSGGYTSTFSQNLLRRKEWNATQKYFGAP